MMNKSKHYSWSKIEYQVSDEISIKDYNKLKIKVMQTIIREDLKKLIIALCKERTRIIGFGRKAINQTETIHYLKTGEYNENRIEDNVLLRYAVQDINYLIEIYVK